LTEITLSGSQIFFVCLIGVWQRNFEPAVCVCVCVCVCVHGALPSVFKSQKMVHMVTSRL